MGADRPIDPADRLRNLLVGLVSIQADLVDRGQFLNAWECWCARSGGSLADVFAEQCLLNFEERREVERLVQRKLAKHRGDVLEALAKLTSATLQQTLAEVHDPELHGVLNGTNSGGMAGRFTASWQTVRQSVRYGLTGQSHFVNVVAAGAAILLIGLAVGMYLFPPAIESEAASLDSQPPVLKPRPQPSSAGATAPQFTGLPFTPPQRPPPSPRIANLVNSLYTGLVRKADVVAYLKRDPMLDDAQRQKAIAWAEDYTQDSGILNDAGWFIVAQPNRHIGDYRHAHRLAQEACRLAPTNGSLINTLGVAEYRVGLHKEAIKTLTRSSALNSESSYGQPHPADYAFLAMSHHQLGRTSKGAERDTHMAEAHTYLGLLRDSVKQNRWDREPEMKAFLLEAEELMKPGVWARP